MKKLFVFFALLAIIPAEQSLSQVKQTISILGDSYSTFYGYIPAANASWYSVQSDPTRTDVTDVKQTWWWQTISEGGYKLGVNDSYSGATVSYTGYNGEDYADRSFITRLPRLGNPDIILIFGGINDNWTGGPIGEYKYDAIERADLYSYRPALARLLQSALNHYPNVKIFFIISDELKDEITESTKTICDHYGIEYIQLQGVAKQNGHPTIAGMRTIAEQVLKAVNK